MDSLEYGYNYFRDGNGNEYAVSNRTGEVTNAVTLTVPVGSIVRTPEQQRAYKEYQEKQEKKKFYRRKIMDELGYFYFVLCENKLGRLSAATAARLIYLCCFLDYEGNFELSQRRRMQKSDLQSVLKLSTGATFKFWKEVNPLYVVEDEKGLSLVTNADIVRGEIKDKNSSYKRFYIKAIKKLYEQTPATKHKHLGYVYSVLPFISREFNIICWNPMEDNLNDVQPMAIEDFCKIIGYDEHDAKKLIEIYKKITFDVKGEPEYFLSFVTNEADFKNAQLFVNPKILYSGKNYNDVHILGAFTKVNR